MSEQNSETFQFEYEPGDKVWLTNGDEKQRSRIVSNPYGQLLLVTHLDALPTPVQEYLDTLTPRGRKTKQRYAEAKAKWEEAQKAKAVVDDGRPEAGDEYWVIAANCEILGFAWKNLPFDIDCWDCGNVYTSEQDAQDAADLQRLRVRYVRFVKAENERLGLSVNFAHANECKWCLAIGVNKEIHMEPFYWLEVCPASMYFMGGEQTYQKIHQAFTDDELRWVVSGVKVEGLG